MVLDIVQNRESGEGDEEVLSNRDATRLCHVADTVRQTHVRWFTELSVITKEAMSPEDVCRSNQEHTEPRTSCSLEGSTAKTHSQVDISTRALEYCKVLAPLDTRVCSNYNLRDPDS